MRVVATLILTLASLAASPIGAIDRSVAAQEPFVAKGNLGSDKQLESSAWGAEFASSIERLLASTTQTNYQHNTQIDEERGTVRCDCSGLIGFMLRHEFPEAYLSLRGAEAPWRKRPLAVTYYETFLAAGRNAETGHWRQVRKMVDVEPGDVMAWRKPAIKRGETTGHVLMVAGKPEVVGERLVRVRIIDSTRSAVRQGFGEGLKTFITNDAGEPTGYLRGDQRQRSMIAMGRLHDSPGISSRSEEASFVGRDVDAAFETVQQQGGGARIVREDGDPTTVPWKIVPERYNFVVSEGKVIDVIAE